MKNEFVKKINRFLTIVIIGFFAFSCKNPDNPQPAASGNYQHGVWIINEGGFGFGNASIDFYHKDKDSLEKNVFENVNGHPLGDVLQSVNHWNGKYYLVVNNSNNILVVDDKTFKLVSVISNLVLPRFILPVIQKAYVTSNTSKEITIIDPTTYSIIGHIPFNPKPDSAWASWTEQMVYYNNNIYVAAVKAGKILVINNQTNQIMATINLSIGVKDLVIDLDNNIWALCDGTLATPFIQSKLYRINPQTNTIEKEFTFPGASSGVGNLTLNATTDSIYFVNGGIYKMGIHETALPSTSLVSGKGHSFYGLGIDPTDHSIYAGDALDFTQNGLVFQYSSNGQLKKVHKDGVGPNGFLFVP